ncbi:sulfatase [Marinobacter pelagius]|uniref:Phosphoglycerol transferase MdoB n=1 Tax=Marinobacter pelagius TaxID=379482 RepID=A0A1I4RPL0_9GAMM|nr:sulfatase [Marinobacter pelagius]SFM54171.1 hypothetical protein SAMN04487961_0632 [Marinobacter pelagius]
MGRSRILMAIAFLLFNGLLLVPALAVPGRVPWLAVEALAIWALLALRQRPPGLLLRILAVGYGALVLLVAADALLRESLGRGLNLYLEVGLVDAAWHLLHTNLGTAGAVLALALLALVLAVLTRLFLALAMRLSKHSPQSLGKPLLLITGLVAALAITPWVGSPAMAFVANQGSLITHTHRTTEAFAEQLRKQAAAGEPRELVRLADKDVILAFIESYGMTGLTDEPYRSIIGPRLETMADELAQAGLTVATGRLESPIQGGQSWLGHLSVLSGQWIENQLAYETLLSSDYPTLVDDFRRTGHETLAVMPAITEPWQEGRLLGYDRIFDHDDLGYQGPPFNWVTMPDQYTWHWFGRHRTERPGPMFAELALISSHAPWVPILPVLAQWDGIGNGQVFRQWEGAGEAPASLWREPDRVREHYARATDYALAVASGFAVRHLGDNTLMFVLGDHQPAPLITGESASRDVIVHVISSDPALVAPFLSGELPGFRPGTRPDMDTAGAPMSRFRAFLHQHYGAP